MDRATSVVALGGGVIGDLAGFAAAATLRGLPFIQIPTTLLAQVDSSVGGKTGINAKQGKNLIGAFHQPIMVLADTGTLATLPARERAAGYAEIFKAGLIADADLHAWCEANGKAMLAGDSRLLAEAVRRAVTFKAAVVGDDERETKPNDGRALLNLGHTFAHALEAETGYGKGLLHGEAVATGLVLAAHLSASLGLCLPGRQPAHRRTPGRARPAGAHRRARRGKTDRPHGARQKDAQRQADLRAQPRHRPRLHQQRRTARGRARDFARQRSGLEKQRKALLF